MEDIAKNWRALSGIDGNWEKLIADPIDNNLRRYLIHYGLRTGAVGDSFNDMKKTPGYSLSLFPPEVLFTRTCLEKGNPFKYEVTDLIYARSESLSIGKLWSNAESTYMGYVAIATDEGKRALGRRDILICWRGTLLDKESVGDVNIIQVPADKLFLNSSAKVHRGFYGIYTSKTSDFVLSSDANKEYTRNSAREQVLAAVRRHVDYYAELNETVSITVVGHSLGAALATLNSMDIVSNGYNKPTQSNVVFPVTTFTYACPHVGNKDFSDLFNKLPDLYLLRIKTAKDIIPDLPPTWLDYHEVGTNLNIDVIHSEHVNDTLINAKTSHQLPIYLYGIASYQGKDKNSKLAVDFDITYLNKYDEFLKDSFMIPKKWWTNVVMDGMVQMENGFWDVRYDYVPPLPARVPAISSYKWFWRNGIRS
ncbi:Phospholipase A1-II 1 [Euphorbia peplus]|nr:Phospholipase A1-II 1 [Euphorbia peplus]